MTPDHEEVLHFWFHRDRAAWFGKDPAFDAEIRERFGRLYELATAGKLEAWKDHPGGALALVLTLDQFPRNMFRGEPRAFAADQRAVATASHAVERGFDRSLQPRERAFLYLPFEHSERLDEQWRALALFAPLAVWPETADVYGWAVKHWDIIRRFGRFPHRNAILGRASTPEEVEFLKQPGSGF